MAKRRNEYKIDSKEVGLELGLRVYKFFLKSEYLHYGYFREGLPAEISNLKQAQENYAELIFSHIPAGVKSILDVGSGSGKTAEELLARGYQVDCVSPGKILTHYIKNKLGDRVTIYNSRFEDMVTDKKYDLVLFSESFQYIPMEKSISGALSLLKPEGFIIVSDFFSNDPEQKSRLGGGHNWGKWLEFRRSLPVTTVAELDITAETSLTIDLVNQLNQEVVGPVWSSSWALGEDRFPLLIKIVRWLYRKKLRKIENKHFTGQRNGEMFRKYKKYMFYLFQAD